MIVFLSSNNLSNFRSWIISQNLPKPISLRNKHQINQLPKYSVVASSDWLWKHVFGARMSGFLWYRFSGWHIDGTPFCLTWDILWIIILLNRTRKTWNREGNQGELDWSRHFLHNVTVSHYRADKTCTVMLLQSQGCRCWGWALISFPAVLS